MAELVDNTVQTFNLLPLCTSKGVLHELNQMVNLMVTFWLSVDALQETLTVG